MNGANVDPPLHKRPCTSDSILFESFPNKRVSYLTSNLKKWWPSDQNYKNAGFEATVVRCDMGHLVSSTFFIQCISHSKNGSHFQGCEMASCSLPFLSSQMSILRTQPVDIFKGTSFFHIFSTGWTIQWTRMKTTNKWSFSGIAKQLSKNLQLFQFSLPSTS